MIRRKGLSLVELLIVIGIASLLTAVALPSMKTILKDRKTNQAALQIRSFIEDARVKAIASGRSVAVVLERANEMYVLDDTASPTRLGDGFAMNACIRLSIAEVLPPYEGDLDQSTCTLSSTGGSTIPNQVTINLVENPSAAMFIQYGNTITFGDWQERFTIISNPVFLPAAGTPTSVSFTFSNGVLASVSKFADYAQGPPVNLPPGNISFRVYAKPRRLFSKPLDLPKGTCVDLSLSGIGFETMDSSQAPFYAGPRSSGLETTRHASPMGAVFSPSLRFASDEIDRDFSGTRLIERQFRPVYLVFNSRGELSNVWANALEGEAMTSFTPNASVFLMVGRTDRVPLDDSQMTLASRFDPPLSPSPGSNLWDASNYWVKIGSIGQPAIGPNTTPAFADPFPADSLIPSYGSILAHCRQSVATGNDESAK